MRLEDALKLERKHFNKRLSIREDKGHDYAKENDCLTNFKVMADLQFVLKDYGYEIPIDRPTGTALWHLLHKFVRILNLINKNVEPKNESVEDTFLDMNNYVDLAKECYLDEQRDKTGK